jgi:hypothetical protein
MCQYKIVHGIRKNETSCFFTRQPTLPVVSMGESPSSPSPNPPPDLPRRSAAYARAPHPSRGASSLFAPPPPRHERTQTYPTRSTCSSSCRAPPSSATPAPSPVCAMMGYIMPALFARFTAVTTLVLRARLRRRQAQAQGSQASSRRRPQIHRQISR